VLHAIRKKNLILIGRKGLLIINANYVEKNSTIDEENIAQRNAIIKAWKNHL
jgi:hypothetical protein